MITAKNLNKIFHSGEDIIHALDHLDLHIKEGEFLAVTGRSGSGKSTLLYQLGALDVPTSGEILIDGVDVVKLGKDERTDFRLRELGFIFQDYALLPELTALENVMVPLLMLKYDKKTATELAEKALKSVGLGDRMNNLPYQLSGGQQQRVSIARAVSHSPKIIFADEPTANLDTETSKMVFEAFLELNKKGQTIVMVTHEQEYADLAQRKIIMKDGKIVDSDII